MIDVHCDKSPDGRHEFFVLEDHQSNDWLLECVSCYQTLLPEQVLPLINAAVRLTAEEADELAFEWLDDGEGGYGDLIRLYAAKWRGE